VFTLLLEKETQDKQLTKLEWMFREAVDKNLPIAEVQTKLTKLTIKREAAEFEVISTLVGRLVYLVENSTKIQEGDIIALIKIAGCIKPFEVLSPHPGIVVKVSVFTEKLYKYYQAVEYGTVLVVMDVIKERVIDNEKKI